MVTAVKLYKCKKATTIHSVVGSYKHNGDLVIVTRGREWMVTIVYDIKDVEALDGNSIS